MRWAMVLAAMTATPAGAQEAPAPACTATVKAEGALAAWGVETAMTANGAATLKVGQAARLTLAPVAAVHWAAAPAKAPAAGTFGGVVNVYVAKAGTYRVALGAGAWLDVIRTGETAATPSTAHAHGPACTGVRKLVDFTLVTGRYAVQVSGAPEATIGMLVVAG
ncbi:MAG: hypothetical protein KGM17_05450 [Sphingomonadales bacterium]|nr:hypothetical protein [Sphingomonadales bacterium]